MHETVWPIDFEDFRFIKKGRVDKHCRTTILVGLWTMEQLQTKNMLGQLWTLTGNSTEKNNTCLKSWGCAGARP